jgi:hypothetical protein
LARKVHNQFIVPPPCLYLNSPSSGYIGGKGAVPDYLNRLCDEPFVLYGKPQVRIVLNKGNGNISSEYFMKSKKKHSHKEAFKCSMLYSHFI